MEITLRPPTPADADAIAAIIHEAFNNIADKHNFPRDFPSLDSAIPFAQWVCSDPTVWGVVAESNGKVVGSNFLHEVNEIAGVGPITIDPNVQAKGVGRKLMQAVIERGKNAPGIRLVQDAFNTASMPLYASLGFDIKEPLVLISGKVAGEPVDGVEVRALQEGDFPACDELHKKIHGFSRINELQRSVRMFPAFVAVRGGQITAYASSPNMWQMNHAVAETVEDMTALLSGAGRLSGQPLAFLLPTRQAELFRWCLSQGMKVVKPMSLMAMGAYQKPRGTFLPSVLY